MLIVLEGCDGAGKTTLARKLAKFMQAEIVHCTAETPNDWEFFSGIIRKSKEKNIIADRFCYGQFVYQHRDDRPLQLVDLTLLESRIKEAGGTVVLVTAPIWLLQTRLRERSETTEIPVEEIQDRFLQFMGRRKGIPILRYDTYEKDFIPLND
jgi:thymidylate kinase